MPDELEEPLALFSRKLRNYPELHAQFLKGLAQTLDNLGGEIGERR